MSTTVATDFLANVRGWVSAVLAQHGSVRTSCRQPERAFSRTARACSVPPALAAAVSVAGPEVGLHSELGDVMKVDWLPSPPTAAAGSDVRVEAGEYLRRHTGGPGEVDGAELVGLELVSRSNRRCGSAGGCGLRASARLRRVRG
jgi:hypothetical protein